MAVDVNLFGWIPPGERTKAQAQASDDALQQMPKFKIEGASLYKDAVKSTLWTAWADPRNVASCGGIVYPGNHQETGCCVGAGGGNTIACLAMVQVTKGQSIEAKIPFWLFVYGKSRQLLGERGRGEGSTGSTFAQAAKQYGFFAADEKGLPTYTKEDGLIWGKSAEMTWSAGDQISSAWESKASATKAKTISPVKSADECAEALFNGYPVSWCGNWGGLMKCEIKDGVLMNRHADTWNHQQSCHGVWNHPTLGRIFYILNNWGLDAHGRDPAGGPPGGYWVSDKDCDYQCKTGECFAWSAEDYFPATDIPVSWIF